jgi:Zn ribbon nucleic-acid-binding protein
MGNRFNYRCPKCGSPDDIEIIILAYVGARLTRSGATIISQDVKNIDDSEWPSENAANAADCDACGFQGAMKDVEPQRATVIELFPRQAIRR